jgi:hypothetical protein
VAPRRQCFKTLRPNERNRGSLRRARRRGAQGSDGQLDRVAYPASRIFIRWRKILFRPLCSPTLWETSSPRSERDYAGSWIRTSENSPSRTLVNKGNRKGRGGCPGPLTDGRGAPFRQPLSCDPSARVASRASCCAPRNRAPAAAPLPRDRRGAWRSHPRSYRRSPL